MGDNSVTNIRIKILKLHAYLHIIGRMSTKFQVNPMKGAGRGAEKDLSDGRPAGRTEGRTDRRNNAHTDGRVSFL